MFILTSYTRYHTTTIIITINFAIKKGEIYLETKAISRTRLMYGIYYTVETRERETGYTCSLFRILMQSWQAGPLSIPHIPSCVLESIPGSVNGLPQ